ncbi:MAG: hypothetical protein GX256_05620 [Fretibacterium sp.]|nr:hypothetical protein [Fretibacterium sp.]
MRKVNFIVVSLLLLLLAFSALPYEAEAAEQRAFALENPVRLYKKTDENSQYQEVDLPEEGVNVPSAVRRGPQKELWYKVKVQGKEGWIFSEGIRLKMGPKSKVAENLFQRYMKARAQILSKAPKGWERLDDVEAEDGGTIETWSSKGALFQLLKSSGKTRDIYFKATTKAACKTFLGFEAIGMTMDALRSKVGTPTVRETPKGERGVNILSYEMSKRDMTLVVTLKSDVVQHVEFHTGKAGEASEAWPYEVLELR